ncbi:FxSxx-COOH system tetratricopeptide repeat protein [Catellatospora sichuanensis]|uniref:FxSxx-COOH system tetratricopeptide repeat protein n=1 Tax=Catellatospora sichuanensis TaxID=1969805 RepID=UPI0011823663|nr:FxSxx-COOH system tetratricopeptide repeat protein [Catellatospora sichuanensis]
MVRKRLRVVTSIGAGVVLFFVGDLAFNAASDQGRWPGPLDLVRTNPWTVLLLLIPLVIIAIRVQNNTSTVPGERKSPCPTAFRLPPRNPNFTGRQDVLSLIDKAFTSSRSARVQAIRGLGGVGKTQIAIEYAYRHLDRFRMVVFLDAEHPESLVPQFLSLAVQLGIDDITPDRAVEATFQRLHDRHRPWLMICDNAGRPSDLRSVLPAGTTAANGCVLVTTRTGGWTTHGPVVDVDVLDRRESVRLLTTRVPDVVHVDAQRIAELLGDLPLALEQAAAYMDFTGTPPAHYLQLLSNRIEDMLGEGEVSDRPGVAIATLWTMQLLTLADQRNAAVELLQLCSVFAAEPIPLDMISRHPHLLDHRLRTAVQDPLEWNQTIGAAVGLGLARRSDGQLVMHRLVQAAIRREMSGEARDQVHSRALKLLVADLPKSIELDPGSWARWSRLFAHVLTVTDIRLPGAANGDAHELLSLAARYLRAVGDQAAAGPLAERALALGEQLYGPDHSRVGDDLVVLARIVRNLNEPATAARLAGRALAIYEAVYAPDHRSVAAALTMLARSLRDHGDAEAALPHAQRTLAINEASYGSSHPETAASLNTMSWILHDVGETAIALVYARRALAIHEATFGANHPEVGVDLVTIAWIMRDLGQVATARPLAERAVAILEARLGAEHRRSRLARTTLHSLRNV